MTGSNWVVAIPGAVPLVLDLLVLSWKRDLQPLSRLRSTLAFWGMVAATVAALPVPLLFWNLPDSQRHTPVPALSLGYLVGFVITFIALPCIAFGRGKFRWVGLCSSAVSLVLLWLFTLIDGLGSAQM